MERISVMRKRKRNEHAQGAHTTRRQLKRQHHQLHNHLYGNPERHYNPCDASSHWLDFNGDRCQYGRCATNPLCHAFATHSLFFHFCKLYSYFALDTWQWIRLNIFASHRFGFYAIHYSLLEIKNKIAKLRWHCRSTGEAKQRTDLKKKVSAPVWLVRQVVCLLYLGGEFICHQLQAAAFRWENLSAEIEVLLYFNFNGTHR